MRRAVEADVDYVEADVWPHARHEVVAQHERSLSPLPLLFDKWYLKLDFRPHSLDDIIEATRGSRVGLYLDLKSGRRGFVWDVMKALYRGGALEGAILSGHYWGDLVEARRRAPVFIFPSVKDRVALARFLRYIARADGAIDGVAIRHTLLTPEVVAVLRDRSLRVLPWTVDCPARASELLSYGVDGLVSNSLALLHEMRPVPPNAMRETAHPPEPP